MKEGGKEGGRMVTEVEGKKEGMRKCGAGELGVKKGVR